MKFTMDAAMNYAQAFHELGILKEHKIDVEINGQHYLVSIKKGKKEAER